MSESLSLQRLALWYERHGRLLPPAANALLVIALAWLLSQLLWALVPTPEAARWEKTPADPVPRP
jgi:general secretion pathway protein C